MTGMKSWMSTVWRQCAATTRTCQHFLEIVRRSCCSTVWSAYLPAPASVLRMYVRTMAHTWCGTHRKGHSMWCSYRVRWIIVCHAVIVLTGGATAYPASIFLQSLRSQKVAVARKACRSSTEAFRSLTLIPKSIQPQSQSLHMQTLSRSLSLNHQPQSYILVLSLILLNLSRMSQTSHSPKSQLSSLKSGRFCHWFQRWHTPLTTGIFWPNIYTSFSSNWVTSVASLAVTVGTLRFPWVCMSFNAQILCTNSFVWTWCCPHVKG